MPSHLPSETSLPQAVSYLRVRPTFAWSLCYLRALHEYPESLDDLIVDRRFVTTTRHLRKLYADPLDPARAWGLVRAPDGGIQGIYSQDTRAPWLRTAVDLGPTTVGPAERYSDWIFMPRVQ
jgi:hypothetical protein